MVSLDKIWLRPWNILNIEGNLAYSDTFHAWNILRFKKEILTEFPQLREKKSQLFYALSFVKTYEDLITYLNKLKKENKPLPLLLWFYKIEN